MTNLDSLSSIADYGESSNKSAPLIVAYDGTSLPYFLKQNGVDPSQYRDFLFKARIGSPFEIEVGQAVTLFPEQK